MRFVMVLVLIAILAWPRPAVAGPEIVGDASKAECQIALGMAKAAFDSTNFSLEWPIFAPDPAQAKVVLARGGWDISAGMGAAIDPAVFEHIAFGGETIFNADHLYWQIGMPSGKRLVLVQQEHSWRGSWYYLFQIDGEKAQTDFLQDFEKSRAEQFHYIGPQYPFLNPVLDDHLWNPPMLLENPQTSALWLLEQSGLGFGVMGGWRVYFLAETGPAESPCHVRFVAQDSYGLDVLPKSVRRFAALADEALGPGTGEGTLQQTSRIRGVVASAWAVLTERPWALTGAPYNSRVEVDAGLAEWARGVPSRLAVLHRLEAVYGRAERALATFYVKKFGLEPEVAARFSGYAMDFMLRSYFVFHSDDRQVRVPAVSVWPVLVR